MLVSIEISSASATLRLHDRDSHVDCFGDSSPTVPAMPCWQNLSRVDLCGISEDVGTVSKLWVEV